MLKSPSIINNLTVYLPKPTDLNNGLAYDIARENEEIRTVLEKCIEYDEDLFRKLSIFIHYALEITNMSQPYGKADILRSFSDDEWDLYEKILQSENFEYFELVLKNYELYFYTHFFERAKMELNIGLTGDLYKEEN